VSMSINYAYVTYHYDGYLDPTSLENRIWGDMIGTCQCDADGSGLLSDVMLEACG
jgi:hypothetical protein